MRRYRHASVRVAVASAAAVAALAPAASAKPKPEPEPVVPICNVIVDYAGDTSYGDADILSGDIASGTKLVTAVLRLRSLAFTDPVVRTGARWELAFTVGGSRYAYSTRRDALGATTSTFTRQAQGGPAVVVAVPMTTLDTAARQVRWSVPRTVIPELPVEPAGTKMYGLTAATWVSPADVAADVALGKSYPDGYPSCVQTG